MSSLISLILAIGAVTAWLTHLFVCFTDDRWGFLIAGAIMFPVAIVHGVGIWLGVWQLDIFIAFKYTQNLVFELRDFYALFLADNKEIVFMDLAK